MPRAPDPSRLSRERIVETAFSLLEREGWETLSMRRLGQELDVWPMAVYRYFRDKDELVDALVEHVVQEVALPGARGAWRARLRRLLGEAVRTLEGLPPEFRARLAPALLGPASPLSTAARDALGTAGLDNSQASKAWLALAAYTAGFPELAPSESAFEDGLQTIMDGLGEAANALEPATST
jgi:TetR/AcrR family tetracycline transcriptional repressor